MDEIDFNIRNAVTIDRSRLANLIHFSSHIHQHLDWKSPVEWIGQKPYVLMERNGILLAALACPPDLPDITWVRLFAVSSDVTVAMAWKWLWQATRYELLSMGKLRVAALSLQGWFNELLESSEFIHSDNVIILLWDSLSPFPKPSSANLTIRPMMPEDLPAVEKIDHAAFGLDWKNSMEALELAYQQASFSRIAECDEEVLGYQFSTSSAMGGHLARLAVEPSNQGKGIGYSLVYDVLDYFKRQGVMHVTVNTQQMNKASLALYDKAGFKITGESYRVYQYVFKE